MSYCLNPKCGHPRNPPGTKICQSCGAKLLLKERYRATDPLGRGGFARTYLALDEDRLNSRCVIKQLLPQLQGSVQSKQAALEKAIDLFNKEAVRLYELGEHPQIPALLASFEQDKRLYLVQEYIPGDTLWQELNRYGPFSEAQILEVLYSILPVLQFIHDAGVIHRDITPVNILRRNQGNSNGKSPPDGFRENPEARRGGELVLIDFGVAKQLTHTSLLQTGTKIGTEGYAPIEQMRSGKVYPASDLYSFGVTCITLLTRVSPDRLFDPIKGWIWRDYLARDGRSIDEGLAGILDRSIEDMVGDRYQSANEMLAALDAIAKPPPSAPATPPPTTPTSPPHTPIPTPASFSSGRSAAALPKVATPPVVPASGNPIPMGRSTGIHNGKSACVRTAIGHTSWVTCLAISPDGHLLASGSIDDKIKIWDFYSGQPLRTLCGHAKSINDLAISSDSKILASCSDDDRVKLWNLTNGKLLATLGEHLRDVNAVVFAPQGYLLASGSEDRRIILWRLAWNDKGAIDAVPIRTLVGRQGMIKSLAIAPNTKLLASGGMDNIIHVWDLPANRPIYSLSGHFNSINALAIHPRIPILASGSKDKTIKLWNLSTGELLSTLSGHSSMVNSLTFSPDGTSLLSGSSDKTLKLWRLSKTKSGELAVLQATFDGHLGAVNAVAFTPDGKTIVSGSWDKTIKFWQRP
jgi:WD40 repeat protein